METALVGALGAVAGSLVTGLIQMVNTLLSARSKRLLHRREERSRIYLEALWEVRRLPQAFKASVLQESRSAEHGDEFAPSDFASVHRNLDRAVFELKLLGKPAIAEKVERYGNLFVEWIMGQDPDEPILGFDALDVQLSQLEEKIIELMQKDLR